MLPSFVSAISAWLLQQDELSSERYDLSDTPDSAPPTVFQELQAMNIASRIAFESSENEGRQNIET